MRMTVMLLFLILSTSPGIAGAAEIKVGNGEELALVLGGGEWNGRVLDDGDVIILDGEDEVFVMHSPPEPYYKGINFAVRTSAGRPADKRQVTIRYAGSGAAEIFNMTAGKVRLSNIMLEGWSRDSCCPVY